MQTRPRVPPAHQEALRYALNHDIRTFRYQARELAAAYKDLGLLYHSFPLNLRFHWRINADMGDLARKEFTASWAKELPPMIKLLGTLDYTLRSAATALEAMRFDQVMLKLRYAHSMLLEASQRNGNLKQPVDIFSTLKNIVLMEGGQIQDGKDVNGERRTKFRDRWLQVLPNICWESEVP